VAEKGWAGVKAIYTPTGNAREYGSLACNLYRGCGHGCIYCYAPKVLRMDRQDFYNNPRPREGIIEALRKDAERIHRTIIESLTTDNVVKTDFGYERQPPKMTVVKTLRPEVFLCFTCDPYQPIDIVYRLTRQAIEILHANEIAVNILTKGRVTDFDLLAKRPDLSKVGVTFDGTENQSSEGFDRYMNLKTAHNLGIKTWVSFEPVIVPSRILELIKEKSLRKHTDEFKIGKWNYDKLANGIDWYKFTNQAIELLEKLGCRYTIKEDLKKYVKDSTA
jgi:DNA repair photolyase